MGVSTGGKTVGNIFWHLWHALNILLFFKLVYLSCILHIVSMTLTRRRRRWWWWCIGVKCDSNVLPAAKYTMYVGLDCLSTTTVGATNNATDTSIVNTSSYASH